MKQAFFPLYKQIIARAWQQGSTFFTISSAVVNLASAYKCLC